MSSSRFAEGITFSSRNSGPLVMFRIVIPPCRAEQRPNVQIESRCPQQDAYIIPPSNCSGACLEFFAPRRNIDGLLSVISPVKHGRARAMLCQSGVLKCDSQSRGVMSRDKSGLQHAPCS